MVELFRHYAHNKQGNPVGVLIAVLMEDSIAITWSKCHKDDRFTRKEAAIQARKRLENYFDPEIGSSGKVPFAIVDCLPQVLGKASRFCPHVRWFVVV